MLNKCQLHFGFDRFLWILGHHFSIRCGRPWKSVIFWRVALATCLACSKPTPWQGYKSELHILFRILRVHPSPHNCFRCTTDGGSGNTLYLISLFGHCLSVCLASASSHFPGSPGPSTRPWSESYPRWIGGPDKIYAMFATGWCKILWVVDQKCKFNWVTFNSVC